MKAIQPKIGPANNAHHWKDWQKRHRAPRPLDLLRKIYQTNQALKKQAQEAEEIYSFDASEEDKDDT